MKAVYNISLILAMITMFCICGFGQTEAIPFNTVLNDADGSTLANINVEVMVDILQGSENGDIIYQESHNLSTGNNGHIFLEIGNGMSLMNQFQNIDWQQPNFISISYRPEGFGMVYTANTVELFSVPYALFSLKVTCTEGCPGPPGETIQCWDLNLNQQMDLPEEDTNGDGVVDIGDCTGPPGPPGPDSADSPRGAQGPQGLPGISKAEFSGIPPANPEQNCVYVDDGSNREDGQIGLRFFDGTNWIDL